MVRKGHHLNNDAMSDDEVVTFAVLPRYFLSSFVSFQTGLKLSIRYAKLQVRALTVTKELIVTE